MDLDYWEKVKKIQTPPNSSINYWQSVIAFLIVAILLGSLPCVTKQVVFYLTPPVQLSMRYMIALLFFIYTDYCRSQVASSVEKSYNTRYNYQ